MKVIEKNGKIYEYDYKEKHTIYMRMYRNIQRIKEICLYRGCLISELSERILFDRNDINYLKKLGMNQK